MSKTFCFDGKIKSYNTIQGSQIYRIRSNRNRTIVNNETKAFVARFLFVVVGCGLQVFLFTIVSKNVFPLYRVPCRKNKQISQATETIDRIHPLQNTNIYIQPHEQETREPSSFFFWNMDDDL